MRVFRIMGNRPLYKIECLHTLSTRESERLKVTALNLFHPTASRLLRNLVFCHIATQPRQEQGRVRGSKVLEGNSQIYSVRS